MSHNNRIYAGVGSRETPEEVLKIFEKIGAFLAKSGFTLRSGHADGADMAFENGCDMNRGAKEIYLPWYGFNGSDSMLNKVPQEAYDMAGLYYNHWESFKPATQKLFARDCQQVLGKDLEIPADFLICWTKDGKLVGGTSMAIRIANDHGVKVFNAGSYASLLEFRQDLYGFLRKTSIISA